MKASTYIAQFLISNGTDAVFELQGGMITQIVDEIQLTGGIRIYSMHHEQAAAFAADGYARVTGRPGVALATSGPGATNLLTGVGSCYFDTVPALFITGQVNVSEQRGDRPVRQNGFQETDIVAMAHPVTKNAFAVKNAEEIPAVFTSAYRSALSGRMGPILIDVPMNVQSQEISIPFVAAQISEPSEDPAEVRAFIRAFLSRLAASKRPLVLAGRGILAANERTRFLDFIERTRLPVVTSLLGLDSIRYDHPERVGFIGTYGNRWANHALGRCDLLLVLGSRLDIRQTGADIASFSAGKSIFHVDIDPGELNNRLSDCTTLQSGLDAFFDALARETPEVADLSEWRSQILLLRQETPDTLELDGVEGINPNEFIHRLARASRAAKVIATDVGNNQMWTAQSFELCDGQTFLSSGGMGAMGYSLPAAIGGCVGAGKSPTLSINGDGGFQINIQELQTVVRNRLPLKIVVLNNRCLGMIRQFQDSYFDSRYQSTVWDYSAPDFVKIARAYGIGAYGISKPTEIEDGLRALWGDPSEPFLLDVAIDMRTNVYPKVFFGRQISDMEPRR